MIFFPSVFSPSRHCTKLKVQLFHAFPFLDGWRYFRIVFAGTHVVVLLNVSVAGDTSTAVQNPLFLSVALCSQQDFVLVWALHCCCGTDTSGGDLWEAFGSEFVHVWQLGKVRPKLQKSLGRGFEFPTGKSRTRLREQSMKKKDLHLLCLVWHFNFKAWVKTLFGPSEM